MYAVVRLCIWMFAQKSGEILRRFCKILGKYCKLGEKSVGSKGLKGFLVGSVNRITVTERIKAPFLV